MEGYLTPVEDGSVLLPDSTRLGGDDIIKMFLDDELLVHAPGLEPGTS